jgi:hypothetical protein
MGNQLNITSNFSNSNDHVQAISTTYITYLLTYLDPNPRNPTCHSIGTSNSNEGYMLRG